MAIPHDDDIQIQLFRLLSNVPGGTMYSSVVYKELAKRFPRLTTDETHIPYGNSVSHFANRVQFARLHLVENGFICRPYVMNDRGFWTITEVGRRYLAELDDIAERLLSELDNL